MTDVDTLESFLIDALVDSAIFALRPDYRALLVAVDGLLPGPNDSKSEILLQTAEASARTALRHHRVEELPHVAAWRDAYLTRLGPGVQAARRLISADTTLSLGD